MANTEPNAKELAEANARMRATLEEIQKAIEPFLGDHKTTHPRTFESQLLHDVRNILNELGLLRALVPGEESDKPQ